ncbi:hypothetical protein MATL_G00023400 [Megalops atlanticus]|uniref:Chemokine interleukin-8-like domain-containing protein n=1 Tax=Megalops atlanticus TaxID=7932 RepID=A0A9D3QDM1_MEGAT|nr:hypothetical protein MATL_G00023400 [Megalops atlanticus]
MKPSAVFLIAVLLLALTVTSARTAEGARTNGCCTRYTKSSHIEKIPLTFFTGCRVQDIRGGCNINAVILLGANGRKICGNPGSKEVKRIFKALSCGKAKTPRQRSRRPRP